MGLTWRDLVSSATMVLIVLAWAGLKLHQGLPLLSSAWAVSIVELGLSTGCALTAAGDLHTRPQPRAGVLIRKATTLLGSIALVAGLAGLIGDSAHALEVLVMAMIMLWLAGTCWHVMSIGSQQ